MLHIHRCVFSSFCSKNFLFSKNFFRSAQEFPSALLALRSYARNIALDEGCVKVSGAVFEDYLVKNF
jgi:hypothetical protein